MISNSFYIHERSMNYAIKRVHRKLYSKSCLLKFVLKDGEYYLIDGYHRLAEHFVFDTDLDIFEHIIVKTKIFKNKFIEFEKFKYP